MLSNLSNDPIGITFQWRKSNTERLFHQALGVNERFRVCYRRERDDLRALTLLYTQAKTVPLTPEILQPEKVKGSSSMIAESENVDHESKVWHLSLRTTLWCTPVLLISHHHQQPDRTLIGNKVDWRIRWQVRTENCLALLWIPSCQRFICEQTHSPSVDNDSSSLSSNISKNEDIHGKLVARYW